MVHSPCDPLPSPRRKAGIRGVIGPHLLGLRHTPYPVSGASLQNTGNSRFIVERWFPEADTNTVLLFLERENNAALREANDMRFVRLRRPLSQIIPPPSDATRRGAIETFLDDVINSEDALADPRMQINQMMQGGEGGLTLADSFDGPDLLDEEEE